MVPEAEAAKRAEAREARVELIAAAPNAGLDAMQRLLQRPPLPDDAARYWIIGHDRITAAAARFLHQNFYPAAARAQFVHTAPGQVEWHKPPDAGSTAAEKSEAPERLELELELDLARTAPRFDSPDAVPLRGLGTGRHRGHRGRSGLCWSQCTAALQSCCVNGSDPMRTRLSRRSTMSWRPMQRPGRSAWSSSCSTKPPPIAARLISTLGCAKACAGLPPREIC
jgi:hypothetical protein